jgi:hypothetical protein
MRPIRQRLSYANVTASVALFIALGGTSYALSLPHNSVGARELRPGSVGRSEIRSRAVRSAEVKDRAIRLRDISVGARQALHGQAGPTGPPGPTFFATLNSAGGQVRGNAIGYAPVGVNGTEVTFSQSMANCVPTATLTSTPGGPNPNPPPTAHVTAQLAAQGHVLVQTWSAGGGAVLYPVNLVVAC